jgi:hypothetical protein
MQKHLSLTVLILGMNLCALAQQTLTPQELNEFFKQVTSNQRRMNAQMGEYTAAFKSTMRFYDDKGKLKNETVRSGESYQSWQRNLEIMLMKDGQDLSGGKVEKEREKAVKALTKDAEERVRQAEQRAKQEGPEYGTDWGKSRISVFDIIRYSKVTKLRRDQWQEREMIVVDFQPIPNATIPEKNLSALAHLNSTLWIDAQDRVIIRTEMRPVTGGRGDGIAYLEESVRLPDGLWLARYMRFNMAAQPEIFNGQNREWIYERSNHQKFTAQIVDESIDAPKPKPR